jgi:hypothetical protein
MVTTVQEFLEKMGAMMKERRRKVLSHHCHTHVTPMHTTVTPL